MIEPPQPVHETPRTKRLYFGHPVNVYGTPFQKLLLSVIGPAFPSWEIVNPDAPEHSAAYEAYAKTRVDGDGKPTGMGYFFEVILPTCQGGVFLPFRDGMFGKGVFGEAEWLLTRKFPIWEISSIGVILPIQRLDAARRLSRDETRARIRHADGTTKPYELLASPRTA
ncbi:MAG: hypothetical protein AAB554_00820 [Patescibacteria group bacterium]